LVTYKEAYIFYGNKFISNLDLLIIIFSIEYVISYIHITNDYIINYVHIKYELYKYVVIILLIMFLAYYVSNLNYIFT